jgi:hypothetical protein
MRELGQLVRALASLSWRYSTFRGRWSEMPRSTGLCVGLGVLSFLSCVLAVWVEYGWSVAVAIPAVWLGGIWLFASADGGMGLNKRLLSAVFLLTLPAMVFLALMGSGQPVIEVLVGVYLSATILTLKARE